LSSNLSLIFRHGKSRNVAPILPGAQSSSRERFLSSANVSLPRQSQAKRSSNAEPAGSIDAFEDVAAENLDCHRRRVAGVGLIIFGTVVLARLVNAATALFAAESTSRNRPISTPRFLPCKRMALNFRFSRAGK
jgi:hypothetical protein